MKKVFLGAALLILMIGAAGGAQAESAMEQLRAEGIVEEKPVYEQDFENWTGSDGVLTLPSADSVEFVDDRGKGNTLCIQIGPPTTGDKELTGMLPTPPSQNAIVRYSVLFTDTDLHRKPMGIFRDNSSTGNEIYLLLGDKNGDILRQPSGEKLISYKADTWYELIYVFNFHTKKYDVFINDEKVIQQAPFPNAAFSQVKRIWFLKLWDKNDPGKAYIDDIAVYNYTPYPTAALRSTADVAYDAENIDIAFSTPIESESVKDAVTVVDQAGAAVLAEGALAENRLDYTLKLKETLRPGETYKICFAPGIISEDEIGLQTESVEFAVKPAVINEILFRCNGKDIESMEGTAGSNVTAYCIAHCEQDTDVMLIAGLYRNGRLAGLVSKKAVLGDGKRINVSIPVPDDGNDYIIKAYAWDGAENQQAYIAAAQLK